MDGDARHDFLASAVAARPVMVRACAADGTLAYSDGGSIIVARCLKDWRPIAAQAALIAAGALAVPQLRRLVGQGQAIPRYVYLEVLRASHMARDRLPSAFTASPDLAAPRTQSPRESLTLAMSGLALPPTPGYFGTIRPLAALRHVSRAQGFSALVRDETVGRADRNIRVFEDDETTEESPFLKLFQNPFSKGGLVADLLNDILGAGVSSQQQNSGPGRFGATDMPVGRIARGLWRGAHAVAASRPADLPDLDILPFGQPRHYPEWNALTQRYRRDYVCVEQQEAWRQDGAQDLGHVLRPPPIALRRQLARLGLGHQWHRRQHDGADLDTDALIESAIDVSAGAPDPVPRIYRASRRTRRELGVAIALDMSGSTGDADGQGLSVFQEQMRAAYQLAHALHALGDTVCVFGFHSWGHKLVRVVPLLAPGERPGSQFAERLSLLEPLGYTRIGAAIRHGARLLQGTIRLPNRLLLLMTDGIAYDHDYEARYAAEDTGKAMQEAREAGTACLCVSLGTGTDRAMLGDVFGAANIFAVKDCGQLSAGLGQVCQRALASVATRSLRANGNSRVAPATTDRA